MKNVRMERKKLLFLVAIASMFFTAFAFAAGMDESSKTDAGRTDISSEQLKGMKVVSSDGKEIGEIKEVKMDQSSSQINYVILAKSRAMGLMDTEYAVPFRALTVSQDENQATLNVAEDLLASAPKPDESDMSSSAFQVQLEQHYGISPAWESDQDPQMMPQTPQMEDEGMGKPEEQKGTSGY